MVKKKCVVVNFFYKTNKISYSARALQSFCFSLPHIHVPNELVITFFFFPQHTLMHQIMMAIVMPILSTCRFQRPPRVLSIEATVFFIPRSHIRLHGTKVLYPFPIHKTTVISWRLDVYTLKCVYERHFVLCLEPIFTVYSKVRLHSRRAIFTASEICLWEMTETRASCCV